MNKYINKPLICLICCLSWLSLHASTLTANPNNLHTAEVMFEFTGQNGAQFITSGSSDFSDDRGRRIEVAIWILNSANPQYQNKLGLFISHQPICHDETSTLEINFQGGAKKVIPAATPVTSDHACGSLPMFIIDPFDFPTSQITSMHGSYKLKHSQQEDFAIHSNMSERLSHFIQTAVTESYLIMQGKLAPGKQ